MKKAVAIFLCAGLMLQSVAHLVVLGLFNLNREYIAKSLCENRNRPSKKCNGKCYLKKQLKKVDDTEHGSSNGNTLKIEKTDVVCLVPDPLRFSARYAGSAQAVQNPVFTHLTEQAHLHSIFHPPAASC